MLRNKGKYDGIRAGSYGELAIQIVAEAGSIAGPQLASRLGVTVYEISSLLRRVCDMGYLQRAKDAALGGNVNLYRLGHAATGLRHDAPGVIAKPSSLPEPGTRAGRALAALFQLGTATVEAELMAAHGLDGLAPTVWRNGPYKLLVSAGLFVQSMDAAQVRTWALTRTAFKLLHNEPEVNAEPQSAAVPLVPARSAPAFRPFDPAVLGAKPQREGAWDFKNIPSHHAPIASGGSTCV